MTNDYMGATEEGVGGGGYTHLRYEEEEEVEERIYTYYDPTMTVDQGSSRRRRSTSTRTSTRNNRRRGRYTRYGYDGGFHSSSNFHDMTYHHLHQDEEDEEVLHARCQRYHPSSYTNYGHDEQGFFYVNPQGLYNEESDMSYGSTRVG
ncbi:hypothetical protein HMI54_011109 [Coelomomyces lativittatus]|nr:hypothetical protein HMI56_005360 [Coelomomyces lativittatus]KAJ1499149.1 hypothetical protein HMI55_004559 [Coelomomyces lativittatus]KAJ1500129.1 hypothetical protein HMI54_011109 [Coelomomyces lativittatus]